MRSASIASHSTPEAHGGDTARSATLASGRAQTRTERRTRTRRDGGRFARWPEGQPRATLAVGAAQQRWRAVAGERLASNPAGNERGHVGERRRASPEWRRGRARASEGRAWFVMLRASRHTSGQDARKGGLWRMLRGGIQDATRRDAGTLHGAGGGVRRAVGEQVA